MPTTPRLAIPYPAGTDSFNVPLNMQQMASALDGAALDSQGGFGSRPVSTPGTPGITGRYYYATDQYRLYRDYGTGWDEVIIDRQWTVPTGALMPWAGLGASLPFGFTYCDGRLLSRTTYAALFAVIATGYGAGDGSTTFGVPDLRSRVPVMEDGGTGRLAANGARGNSGGTEKHTLTTAELASHNHGVTDPSHTHTTIGELGQGAGAGGSFEIYGAGSQNLTAHAYSATTGISINNNGSGSSHNNMPPYQVMGAWMIKN